MQKVNLFISYAHADKEYLDEFSKFLNPDDCPNINIWTDDQISLGQAWNNEIENSLNCADIVLLIISQDFLMSPYIKNNELSVALKRHEEGKSTVIPIFLRYCNLDNHPQITKLQGYPGTNTPLLETGVKKDRHYSEIQEKINDLAKKLITRINISNSATADNGGERSGKAKEIEQLKNTKKIFLSIPSSPTGLELRKNFIITVEGKIKYDTPKWPYEIVPGITEAQEIKNDNDQHQEEQCKTMVSQCIYSIHIIDSIADLKNRFFSMQYQLAKNEPMIMQRILWFTNAGVKEELDTLDETLKIELKMLPMVVGQDHKEIFNLIEGFDILKEQKINKLSAPFSPLKKIFMFYDFENDNNNELRIRLRKKLQEDKKFTIRDLADESIENQKKGIEECTGAFIFYGPNSNSAWYRVREKIILNAANIKGRGAVCVDATEEPEIEKKIDRDVSVNEILPIKGEKELETKVVEFKRILQEES